jgi:DNA-binding CsgD family transcriptional regulator
MKHRNNKGKEEEILQRLADGQKTAKIASDMKVSLRAIEWAIMVLKGKHEAENIPHLIAIAFRNKMIK